MQTARILGTTHATTKHASLDGSRLVVIQPLLASGDSDGPPLIAIDPYGAKANDLVMITSDALLVRDIVKHTNTPARWSVLGLIDAAN